MASRSWPPRIVGVTSGMERVATTTTRVPPAGTHLADEAVSLAAARPGIAADPLFVVALGEGGRAVPELHAAEVTIDAAFVKLP